VKKVLSGILIAIFTFSISFCMADYLALYHLPEAPSQISHLDKKLEDVRPPLHKEFLNLSDSARAGLRGPVKFVDQHWATFIYKEGNFEAIKGGHERPQRTNYSFEGKKIKYPMNGCGNGDLVQFIFPIKSIFDEKGFLIEEIHFQNFEEDDRTISFKLTYRYDAQGNLMELYYYDDLGNITNKIIYKYKFDSQGNWTERIVLSAEQLPNTGELFSGYCRKITYYSK
jgi:hypothetical protein